MNNDKDRMQHVMVRDKKTPIAQLCFQRAQTHKFPYCYITISKYLIDSTTSILGLKNRKKLVTRRI